MAGVRKAASRLVDTGSPRITVYLTPELDRVVRKIAADKDVRVATLLRQWIEDRAKIEGKPSS